MGMTRTRMSLRLTSSRCPATSRTWRPVILEGQNRSCTDSSVHKFVGEFLTQIYDRSLGTGLNWCSEWWKHTEAVFYLTALWHSWEGLRASGELTAMATWSVQYLYPIMDRLMSENGPFKGCQPDLGHRKGEHKEESAPHPGRVLPTTPPPPGLVDERR